MRKQIVGIAISNNMSSKIKNTEAGSRYGSEDYLTDPAMWFDTLPQPFRTIDQLLSDILETAWEAITEREATKERDRDKVYVPSCFEVEVVEAASGCGARCVQCGGEGVVFVGGRVGVWALRVTPGCRPQLIGGAGSHLVEQLSARTRENLQIVAAVGGGALSVFAFTENRFVLVSQFHDGSSTKVQSAVLSMSCSHIAIISAASTAKDTPTAEDTPTMEVHSLPCEEWASEVQAEVARQDGIGSGTTSSGQNQEPLAGNYSKASLIMTIAPPPTCAPCPTHDPSQAFNNAVAHLSSVIGAGDHHLLTSKYLENRRNGFLSQSCGFGSSNPPANGSHEHPVCYFLQCQKQTTHVAITWGNQTHVSVYKIESPSKGSQVLPVLVLPHSAAITASTVSPDGRVMAVGTRHGAVTLWDHQTVLYRGMVEVGKSVVTSLAFVGPSHVVAGTPEGLEIVHHLERGTWTKNRSVPCSNPTPIKTVLPFLSAQGGVCCCTTSMGDVEVWSACRGRPICRLVLPTAHVISDCVQSCAISGRYALVAGHLAAEGKESLLQFKLPLAVEEKNEADVVQCDAPKTFAEELEARLREAIRNEGRA